ncbi:SusC/RagA family TonB-linked outer membrane protein [Alistipes sp.]|uniref:SusC/RagA family TonB-linked outer membrane protein n=1 Tax=Alistipes sp. TaxID=1872444 RepID=UPI003AF165DB
MVKLHTLLLAACTLLCLHASAQTASVSGKVEDADGNPVAGASVLADGTTTGTTTDRAGRYRIRPGKAQSLTFSFLGLETRTVRINGRTRIDVRMAEDRKLIEEVVVNVGYGQAPRSSITGAIASIRAENMEGQQMLSIDQGLQGRISGVQITQSDASPGGGLSFLIRGSNSLIGGTEPLYVVDGFPIEGGNTEIEAPTGNGNPPQNLLNFLNPSDIASIEVLKDAASTAIYGARGANGVVIITTKKGYARQTRVTVSNTCSFGRPLRRADPCDAYDFAWFANMRKIVQDVYYGGKSYEETVAALPYRGSWSSDGTYKASPEDYRNGTVMSTDWVDVVTRTGFYNKTMLSVTGGSDRVNYYISGGYDRCDGIVIGSDFQRYSFSANIDAKPGRRWTLANSAKLSYSYGKVGQTGLLNGENRGVLMAAYMYNPTTLMGQTLFDEEYGVVRESDNPYIQAMRFKDRNSTITAIENLTVKYRIAPGLTLEVNGGVNYTRNVKDMYYPLSTKRGSTQGNGRAFFGWRESVNLLNNYVVTYNRKFGRHDLTATGAYEMQYYTSRSFNSSVYGFLNDLTENYNFGAATNYYKPSSGQYARASASLVVRGVYNYDNRYIFNASLRADGDTRFGKNNKWGYFPSAGFAWRLINEPFFDVPLFSDFKVRASWGVTGNSSLGVYKSLALVGTQEVAFGDSVYVGYAHANIPNPDLRWEKTDQYNVGLDIALFRNRLAFTADIYQKDTRDLLQNLQLAPSTGYGSRVRNLGHLRNRGVELSLKGVLLRSKKIYWDLAANWYTNTSEMVSLGDIDEYRVEIVNSWSPFRIAPGARLGEIYGYKVSHIIKTPEQQAAAAIDNPNKGIGNYDYEKDAAGYMKEQVIGKTTPDFCYGFSTTFRYRGFTLSANFSGSVGNDLINVQQQIQLNRTQTHKRALYNFWIPEIRNSEGEVMIPDNGKEGLCLWYPASSAHDISKLVDRYIEDGSYFKMNNLSIAYSWKPRKIKWIGEVRPSLSIDNVFCITDYSGVNPETSLYGQNPVTRGVAYYEYPMTRTFSIGLSITFK